MWLPAVRRTFGSTSRTHGATSHPQCCVYMCVITPVLPQGSDTPATAAHSYAGPSRSVDQQHTTWKMASVFVNCHMAVSRLCQGLGFDAWASMV